jgi:surface protein
MFPTSVTCTPCLQEHHLFNQDLSRWNTLSVVNMGFMCNRASSFQGSSISNFFGNVQSMSVMFQKAESFDCDLSRWNTSNAIDLKYMFYGASLFS